MWWYDLGPIEQVGFVLAIIASVVLVIQFVMLILGFSGLGGDYDFNVGEVAGIKLLTFRGIVSFFAVGGWMMFGLYPHIGAWSIAAGVGGGIATAILLAIIMKLLLKLEHPGSVVDYKKGVGRIATVYLRIPADKQTGGKISITLTDKLIECNAMTEGDEIETGAKVKILSLVDEKTFLVRRMK